MANAQPAPSWPKLAQRLRDLREHEFRRLTQSELGQALGDDDGPLSPATISMWENAASGRIPPPFRLEAYARLYCTPRSFEGGVRMLSLSELTDEERDRFSEIKEELIGLRESAVAGGEEYAPREAQSMWHFPDGSRITLVCYRLPPERRPPSADRDSLHYVRWSDLADLDSLIEIYGAIRAYNPRSKVVIMAAQDLDSRNMANHLVLIGGLAWKAVMPWYSRIFPIPIVAEDPAKRKAILVHEQAGESNGKELEFSYTLDDDGELVEDVGFFVRGENPSAPKRTLTICGGITTRGVRGAAMCFIDPEMRERNERYLFPRFPEGSAYCIVFRVPVANKDPLTPDLSKVENRLYEWHSSIASIDAR
jgi:transcriptional regulator with XRE-family HTH domain